MCADYDFSKRRGASAIAPLVGKRAKYGPAVKFPAILSWAAGTNENQWDLYTTSNTWGSEGFFERSGYRPQPSQLRI